MGLNPKEEAALGLINEDKAYENHFFNKVSEAKWFYPLKERGYFDTQKSPGPKPAEEKDSFYIPEWNVLPYLERISQVIATPEDEKYIDELLEIIKKVSSYKNSKGKHLDNYRTWWYFVKILVNIPNNKIPEDIIKLIPIWLDSRFDTTLQGAEIATSLLPKFLNENSTEEDINKAEIVINYITDIKSVPLSEARAKLYGEKNEFQFKLDSYWLEKALNQHLKLIAEKCSVKVIESLIEKINKMLERKTNGTYRSFYIDDQGFEPLDFFTNVLKNILNEKAKVAHSEINDILKEFITHEFYYFQKMALYVIGQNINIFKDLVWEYLDEIIGDSGFRQSLVGDELKHLLKNLRELSPKQKKLLKDKIVKGPTKDLPEEAEKYKLRWKQKLSNALSHVDMFKELYEELQQQTKEEAELRPGVVWLGMRSGREESPLDSEKIIQKSNEELAKILQEFKSEDPWKGPTVDGLSDSLKDIVKENPDKFLDNMKPFLNIGYLYIYDILWGLRDAWKDKKSINWENLFKFIKNYIEQEGFWDDKLKVEGAHWPADHNWVLRLLGELIQEGTKDDNSAFDASLLPLAEEILLFILNKISENPLKDDEEARDPVTHALNSAPGNIITALIFLALRKARLEKREKKKGESKWSSELKTAYDSLLNKHIAEALTLLGQYFPNFLYLDRNWAISLIDKLKKEEDEYWSYFIIGYVFGGRVYFDLFNKMIPHYERAIHFDFKEDVAEERLIQHIAIGYLSSVLEIQKESLIDKIIEKAKPSQIDILVRYFRSQWKDIIKKEDEKGEKEETKAAKNEGGANNVREKIMNFWKCIYQKYKEKSELTNDEKEIMSHLLMLTIFLPKIDEENYKWISLSLSNVKRMYDVRFLIEDLNVLKDKGNQPESGKFVGKIFIEILKQTTPTLFKDNIRSIIKFLYEVGDSEAKKYGDDICNHYAKEGVYDESGVLFLKDIYEKYNK